MAKRQKNDGVRKIWRLSPSPVVTLSATPGTSPSNTVTCTTAGALTGSWVITSRSGMRPRRTLTGFGR